MSTENNLYSTEELRIDYIGCGSLPKAIAFTFMSWMQPGTMTMVGSGYGGEFLLRNHFDLVAFKPMRNYWYQDVSIEILRKINSFIDDKGLSHLRRVGYGSSMGGYAAIQFSGLLRLDTVLALSPQYEINQSYDTRWQREASQIAFCHRIERRALNDTCRYFVVYDPHDTDVHHVRKFKECMGLQLHEIRVPHSGHPSAHFLAEIGTIKDLALGILSDDSAQTPVVRSKRRLSKTYLYNLAKAASVRNKNRRALAAINEALKLDENSAEFHRFRSVLLDRLQQPEQAMSAALRSLELSPAGAHQRAHLSHLLAKSGKIEEALRYIDEAIAINAYVSGFYRHQSALLDRSGRLDDAIVAAGRALELAPSDDGHKSHLDKLLSRVRVSS